MMRETFVRSFAATAFIFAVIIGIALIPVNVSFLNPVSQAFEDFELSDIVFSRLRETPKVDTNIVIVNISQLPKQMIAAEIERLNQFRPKAIGLDVFPLLENPYHPEFDFVFMQALIRYRNVVLASKLEGWNDAAERYDSLRFAPKNFSDLAHSGFVNLIVKENEPYHAVRECTLWEMVRDAAGRSVIEYSMAAKLVQLYDTQAFERMKQRGEQKQTINYHGNLQHFYVLDVNDVLDTTIDLSAVAGKIVLLGYLGDNIHNPTQAVEDRFFTPLNERYIGKADRDMYGVVIHANIISMLLRGDYIEEMPQWMSFTVAIVFCFIFVVFLSVIDRYLNRFYEVISLLSQLVLSVAILAVTLACFHYLRYNANLSLVLVIVALAPNLAEIWFNLIRQIFSTVRSRLTKSTA